MTCDLALLCLCFLHSLAPGPCCGERSECSTADSGCPDFGDIVPGAGLLRAFSRTPRDGTTRARGRGGIGRRKGLKIPRWQRRVGSSPTARTSSLRLPAIYRAGKRSVPTMQGFLDAGRAFNFLQSGGWSGIATQSDLPCFGNPSLQGQFPVRRFVRVKAQGSADANSAVDFHGLQMRALIQKTAHGRFIDPHRKGMIDAPDPAGLNTQIAPASACLPDRAKCVPPEQRRVAPTLEPEPGDGHVDATH